MKDRDLQTVRAILQFKLDPNQNCDHDLDLRQDNVLIDLLIRGTSMKNSGVDLAILEALLMAGANPNTFYSHIYWENPLLSELITADAQDAVVIMVKYGADPNMYFRVDHAQQTALYEGISWEDGFSASLLGWLIDQGADIMKPVIMDTGFETPTIHNPACEIYSRYKIDD